MSLDGGSRGPWRPTFLIVTCEHAGRDVPTDQRRLFRGARAVLDSHRGYDIGALGVAMRFASSLSAPLVFTTVTRLLVEPNRSVGAPGLFSEYTRDLPDDEKAALVARYHAPHRAGVERPIAAAVEAGHRVLHVGVHSYTDVLDGARRDYDFGLLFDPARPSEVALCAAWRAALSERCGAGRVRFNEPYLGADDGLTTTLRTGFPADAYAGVEIEIRQGLIRRPRDQRAAGDLLATTLEGVGSLHSRAENSTGCAESGPKKIPGLEKTPDPFSKNGA